MNKRIVYLLLILPMVLGLAACSGIQLPGSATQTPSSQSQANQPPGFENQPMETRLAVGTLQLEGTDQAVTAQQAKDLLPLWKAVKSLGTSSTASREEVSALYAQIQEAMTPEQVQAIEKQSLTREEMNALMEQYGVQMPQGGGGLANLSESERATRVAQFQSQNGNNTGGVRGGFQGGLPGGGVPPEGGFPGGAPDGNQTGSQPAVQGTPQPRQGGRAMGGINILFVDPLLKLLEQRAAE